MCLMFVASLLSMHTYVSIIIRKDSDGGITEADGRAIGTVGSSVAIPLLITNKMLLISPSSAKPTDTGRNQVVFELHHMIVFL